VNKWSLWEVIKFRGESFVQLTRFLDGLAVYCTKVWFLASK
jgi:hypothetical protein